MYTISADRKKRRKIHADDAISTPGPRPEQVYESIHQTQRLQGFSQSSLHQFTSRHSTPSNNPPSTAFDPQLFVHSSYLSQGFGSTARTKESHSTKKRYIPPNTQLAKQGEPKSPCSELKPCNNPACEDVEPCLAESDTCREPEQCLGNICYNASCVPGGDVDFACDLDCENATRCVTPCFGDDCDVPICHSPCTSSPVPTCGGFDFRHQQQGNDILCQSTQCEIPGTQCVDPQCLSLDYAPAEHFHHDFDEFFKFTSQWPADSGQAHSGCADHSNGHHNMPLAPFVPCGQQSKILGATQQYPQPNSLQPLLDWNNATTPHQCTESLTDAESHVPELTHSLSATPSTPVSWRPATSSSFSPTTHQRNICLWMVGYGEQERPCGAAFSNTSDLQTHLDRYHIEPLQRDPGVPVQEGFYCRWLGCSRNTTTNRPVAFAARPKLKRHVQTHTMHKPFTCPTCGIAMKTKDAMEKHERTHSGERPYSCSVKGCRKIFATSTELKTHMVVHSGRKPHECPICHEGFADSSNLSKHKKTHFVGMYRCPDPSCGARMKRWDQMRRHITSQGHAPELLEDAEKQRDYKKQMEMEWMELPDEQKLIASEVEME